ncbi:MAG: hypothetical protein ABSH23_02975 [Steroidobacteraceae bacterium]|jgi:hypothetical protein
MSSNARLDGIDQARARLRASRAEIFGLARELRGDAPGEGAGSAYRSHLMRALSGTGGKAVLGVALLAVALLRPRLLRGVVRLAPLLQPLVIRYLAHRILG